MERSAPAIGQAAANAGVEKPIDFPAKTLLSSVPQKTKIQFEPFLLAKITGKPIPPPTERKRRQITPEDIAIAFKCGERK